MRIVIIILHSIYIAIISGMLVNSVCRGHFREFFVYDAAWLIHTAISVLLAIIGLAIAIAVFRKPNIVLKLQMLWWSLQLPKLEVWNYSPDKSEAVFHSLYHQPMGPMFAFQFGVGTDPNTYLWIKLNVVALSGLLLALIMQSTQRAQPVATAKVPDGPPQN